MNKNGLKPCPFCGKEPKTYQFPTNKVWVVTCKCGAESPHDSISEHAAKVVWNRRRYPFIVDREQAFRQWWFTEGELLCGKKNEAQVKDIFNVGFKANK